MLKETTSSQVNATPQTRTSMDVTMFALGLLVTTLARLRPSNAIQNRHDVHHAAVHWHAEPNPAGRHGVFFLVFDHLARAALWAISRRCSGESAAALASPPFLAPSLDKATACGFFFFSPMALGLYMPHLAGKNNIEVGA